MFGTESGRLTLFSLGLGPWMSARILTQFVRYMMESYKAAKTIEWDRITLALTIVNSVAQAYLRTINAVQSVTAGGSLLVYSILSILLLETGAILTIWLANKNKDWGIGGPSLLIAANTLDRLRKILFSGQYQVGDSSVRIFIAVYLALITIVVFLLEDAELHIHVNRVMIRSTLTDDYIAIKGNPSGSMAVVYGMALYSMLGTASEFLLRLFPDGVGVVLLRVFDLNNAMGETVFIMVIWSVTVLLPLLTINPSELADRMKRNNEYTENIVPGEQTYHFMKNRILLLSVWSAFVLCALVIAPFIFWTDTVGLGSIRTLPITWFVYIGIVLRIMEEGKVYHTMQHYKAII